MGWFDDDGGGITPGNIVGGASAGVGNTLGAPMMSNLSGAAGGGMGSFTDMLAGYDPTRAATSGYNTIPAQSDFANQDFKNALAQQQQNAGMMFAPGAGGAPSFAQGLMGNYNQAQGQQQNLINNLQQQAQGQGPGAQLSHNFMNQAMNQNAANAMGLASSQRGISPGMAARMAGQNSAAMNAQAVGQGANMNLQQQLGAQQQLGNVLNQNMGANSGMLGTAQQAANQQYMGNQGLLQQTQAQNAANQMQAQDINAQTSMGNAKQKGGLLGGAMSGIGSVLGMALAQGGTVPGQAYFNGDDVKNDTVDAKLSPGEIVIPRSAAKDREKAIRFLDALKGGDSGWRKKKGAKADE